MIKKFTKTVFSISLLIIISCNNSDEFIPDIQANCLPTNLQNGVIAFYPFSNGSLNDYSGNNYNLSNPTTASPGADRDGNPSCSFSFVQTNGDFLKYTNPTFIDNFQTLPFSISLWYKLLPSNFSYELLIGRDLGLHCPDTFGQWSVGLYDGRSPVFGINGYSLWEQTSYPENQWKHLVVTCQGNNLKLYINGTLTSETTNTGCSINSPTTNSGDLFIGKDFTGLLDDVIIYNHELTLAEIDQLYNLPACCQ